MLKEYYLPSIKCEGWGKFVIDDTGYFSVVSDYGNYAYQWTAFGDDFKGFLSHLDADYLMGKLAGRRAWFDHEATTLALGNEIVRQRKERMIEHDDARDMWDALEGHYGEQDVIAFMQENWKVFDECGDMLQYDHTPQMRAFARQLYPRFVAELKKEITHATIP
jgi:hypothetical protein